MDVLKFVKEVVVFLMGLMMYSSMRRDNVIEQLGQRFEFQLASVTRYLEERRLDVAWSSLFFY